jgi:hypothetical protein
LIRGRAVIPHLSSLLEMNKRGEMPMTEIVAHIVKSIALDGRGSDYADLPEELKRHVEAQVSSYRQGGGWFLVSNNGLEDYGQYAEAFLAKVSHAE